MLHTGLRARNATGNKQGKHSSYPHWAYNIFRDNKKQSIVLWLENYSNREVKDALHAGGKGMFPGLESNQGSRTQLSEKSRHRWGKVALRELWCCSGYKSLVRFRVMVIKRVMRNELAKSEEVGSRVRSLDLTFRSRSQWRFQQRSDMIWFVFKIFSFWSMENGTTNGKETSQTVTVSWVRNDCGWTRKETKGGIICLCKYKGWVTAGIRQMKEHRK